MLRKKNLIVKGISHITFICKNLEKTSKIFKEIFGAAEIYASGDKTFSLSQEKFFEVAGLWIAIMEGDSIHKTYNHVAFNVSVDDIPLYKEKIIDLGLEILPSRKRTNGEGDSLYFYDYDGHLFELHAGDLDTRLKYYHAMSQELTDY